MYLPTGENFFSSTTNDTSRKVRLSSGEIATNNYLSIFIDTNTSGKGYNLSYLVLDCSTSLAITEDSFYFKTFYSNLSQRVLPNLNVGGFNYSNVVVSQYDTTGDPGFVWKLFTNKQYGVIGFAAEKQILFFIEKYNSLVNFHCTLLIAHILVCAAGLCSHRLLHLSFVGTLPILWWNRDFLRWLKSLLCAIASTIFFFLHCPFFQPHLLFGLIGKACC